MMLALGEAAFARGNCMDFIYKVWSERPKPYKVWNPEVSTTAIREMVDGNSIRPERFYQSRIMMGGARIVGDLPRHQHKETEIYYILKGKGKTFLTTKQGERELDIGAGSFFYLPAGMPHYTVSDPSDPLEFLYVFPANVLENIKYIFDDSLPLPTESPLIGKLSVSGEYPLEIVEETLLSSREQVMKHLRLPLQKKLARTDNERGKILFVRWGEGMIAINGEEFPIKEGTYLYLGEGASYSLQSADAHGLDILIFE